MLNQECRDEADTQGDGTCTCIVDASNTLGGTNRDRLALAYEPFHEIEDLVQAAEDDSSNGDEKTDAWTFILIANLTPNRSN
jgi:hypothetical protein